MLNVRAGFQHWKHDNVSRIAGSSSVDIGGQLSEDADDYIRFFVDGDNRMQSLI